MMMANTLVYLVNGLRPWHAKGMESLAVQTNKEISLVHNVVVDVDVKGPLPQRYQGLVV